MTATLVAVVFWVGLGCANASSRRALRTGAPRGAAALLRDGVERGQMFPAHASRWAVARRLLAAGALHAVVTDVALHMNDPDPSSSKRLSSDGSGVTTGRAVGVIVPCFAHNLIPWSLTAGFEVVVRRYYPPPGLGTPDAAGAARLELVGSIPTGGATSASKQRKHRADVVAVVSPSGECRRQSMVGTDPQRLDHRQARTASPHLDGRDRGVAPPPAALSGPPVVSGASLLPSRRSSHAYRAAASPGDSGKQKRGMWLGALGVHPRPWFGASGWR
jgi:hypothetical protein